MNTQLSQRRWVARAFAWWALAAQTFLWAGCANPDFEPKKPLVLNLTPGPAPLSALDQYKVAAAQRVTEVNAREITPGNPQPMLRSVVSLEYWVDRNGNVTSVALYRSNGDHEAERIAVASLRRASPLPAPSRALVDSSGRVRAVETWLFNNDGRFQLRSVAAPQIDGQ
ncbi:energy transducer TonB [Pandoraea nosoerga]|uniref:Energy transducer TonB n=1 Tax=Pandoraea nosoerga TaxID=2508296 RepID=A0A5E4UNY9_9BURK|nr:energy transducer TonB [Pandoraea nosoerga]MBN4664749.1 energy transducer TonB [Pandoraea nosoerga]MBN4674077.1 energy transducer TonB [Pandoraea nosoerga]MBN4679989.1 energy transducer TonB [Pandoraea nosoerga]MBN4744296.1 energy transducer TonB [Pandoraea nosoerga]VVE00585.1 energy transducer TonB [Pandoraea nosoerga]